jgi:photosystem II stability/assembly factor-like uncharacterized protein
MFLNRFITSLFCVSFFLSQSYYTLAQSVSSDEIVEAVSNFQLRGIGPAIMGGRISDIAVSHADKSTWYVAVGSGGLWKTVNRGISWESIFDEQNSYSVGTVSIDPNNSEIIWVGTGENVSGRHVGWGDGIYKSLNAGQSWQRMGLEKSEHIGKIIIDPRNSDVVFVASEGPLWSAGGQRGLYKTEDGGNSWQLALEIDENTGITDIEFDPSSPEVLYAAAYQRRRHTWSLLAGGPKSGIYKSSDGGDSWRRLNTGLPKNHMGKIGIAVTPSDARLVYATIEANNKEKGFYRSNDKGESWEKLNSYISGGTGPHYYQEIEASPNNPDLVYQMDVFLHVTRDGGENFNYLGTGREKHSDNHALWIDPDDDKHLIAGTDGGLYESYDEGLTWRHFSNLPISQFYKLGLDNSEPFYNIVGGAQDLGTLIGPSRTMNTEGIRNQDWYVPLGADGYESVFDPNDPNIAYMEIQQGLLHRLDRRSKEIINIQPQPEPTESPERWNWDSPLQISPHNSNRLYFGSQRLWKSDNQGHSWQAISKDLTTNTNRYELETIDNRVWSTDALYDTGAMSKYATLTAISESPKMEGLLYTGSDDGVIHVSENGGQKWIQSYLPNVPKRSFINDIEASNHNSKTVFASADAHKLGDYRPYLFMSDNRGLTWKSITGDLPNKTIVWVIKQDFIDENLLFIGTEYGIYFSPNKGVNWVKLSTGVPTIAFRDIELHSRDNDLVGASFGRGFYVFDDYSPLRNINEVLINNSNTLFAVRDAWWYIPNTPMQAKGMPSQGTSNFKADNPPFGALFTYLINELPKNSTTERQDEEKLLEDKNSNIPFPGWSELFEEEQDDKPQVLLSVSDAGGNSIRWIKGISAKGLHRVNWDLRLPPPNPINLSQPAFKPPWVGNPQGPLVAPGKYGVTLYMLHNGKLNKLADTQMFTIKPVPTTIQNTNFEVIAQFQVKTSELLRQVLSVGKKLDEASKRIKFMNAALLEISGLRPKLFADLKQLETSLADLKMRMYGNPIRQRLNESSTPTFQSRIWNVVSGHWDTRQNPTETQRRNIEIAENEFDEFRKVLSTYLSNLKIFEEAMESAGAPYTPGRQFD